jgi:hypothetical protein
VFEKLFHEDQPIGGNVIDTAFAPLCALTLAHPQSNAAVIAARLANAAISYPDLLMAWPRSSALV